VSTGVLALCLRASRSPPPLVTCLAEKHSPEGAVTRTQIGRAQSGGANLGSGRGGGFPCPERFVSKDAERVAGCEMALDVEGVEDRGVNRQEALG
jgi:hypothetical protein